jgi:hypothetical protein
VAERILIAAGVGLGEAAIVWAASTGMHLHHVWPGTIFGFASGTMTTLIFLRVIRR